MSNGASKPGKLPPRRVIKLGGSLFTMPSLVERFRAWLAAQPSAKTFLIAGGGAIADVVREADRLHSIPELEAHWLCVRAMHLQTEILAALLPETEFAPAVDDWHQGPPQAGLVLINPWRFLTDEDPRYAPAPLPESWDVTSDSIAARLAQITQADELVLLKSALPPTGDVGLNEMATNGYVDRYFPSVAQKIPRVRLVNLRDAEFRQLVIEKPNAKPDRQ